MSHNAPVSPSSENEAQPGPTPGPSVRPVPFTKQIEDELIKEGEFIMSMDPNRSLEVSTWNIFIPLIRSAILLFSNSVGSMSMTP